jgi:HlyD family secretion protein
VRRVLWALALVSLALALAASFSVLRTGRPPASAAATPAHPAEAAVVGPGRIEPLSEEIRVSAEIEGRLREVRVDEGNRVRRGDTVAVIENTDYVARVALAEAEVAARSAELDRVISGARAEERREAAAAVREAEATVANAQAELRRYQALYADRLTAREQVETRDTAAKEADARLEAARHHLAFVEAAARSEDRARAEAQVQLARAHLAEARSLLDKTTIAAPITGVVLRRHFRAGETVAAGAPILTLGDLSRLRIRMEIDERDVGRIHLGQSAWCTAEAYPSRRFQGHVVRIGQMLGRKNVRSDDPAERADRKVLEALIELEPGTELPTGLRVDVFVK